MRIYRIADIETSGVTDELNDELNDPLQEFLKRWESEGLSVYVFDRGSDLVLNELIVPKINRNEGIGTGFMIELTKMADELNKRILLTPDTSYGATSIGRLQKFYRRFGFVMNKGRDKDYSISEGMYRNPR